MDGWTDWRLDGWTDGWASLEMQGSLSRSGLYIYIRYQSLLGGQKAFKSKAISEGSTDRQTDRPTDRPTDTHSYRDARTHLKRLEPESLTIRHDAIACHHLITSSRHHVIMLSYHHVIMSSCHHIIMPWSHHGIMSPSHHVIRSLRHHVITTSCHHFIMSSSLIISLRRNVYMCAKFCAFMV